MTIEEIESELRNGLHDANIRNVSVNYTEMSAELLLSIWVGELSSSDLAIRERYRDAVLVLTGLSYFLIDCPDPRYPYSSLNVVSMSHVDNAPTPAVPIPKDDFACEIFVSNWNSTIRFSACDAELKWIELESRD